MEILSNFTSLLEIAAGVNIAFVAVEYSKGYTQTLSEKVFDFPNIIRRALSPCEKIICQKVTLNEMEPITIGDSSTFPQIQKSIIDIEKLEVEIQTKQDDMKERVLTICNYAHFPSLSLWNFLFSIILLFMSGVESIDSNFALIFALYISVFTLLYQGIGWFVNDEKTHSSPYCLTNSILFFIGTVVISYFATILSMHFTDFFYNSLLIDKWIFLITLLPFINFVVFFYLVRKKVKHLKLWIKSESEMLIHKGNEIQDVINDLIGAINTKRRISIE